ncbi:MAG: Lnb N-terminal periplasmic domain-containing protein [Spongiibacteraceae bacterium]
MGTLSATHANAEIPDELHQKLATSPAWLALLSYRKPLLGKGYLSQADDVEFFLADNGKYSPESELAATIAGLYLPPNLADQHPRCRFPARYHWLLNQLGADTEIPDAPKCEKFSAFEKRLDAAGATMIFPAAYLNSPSSMFGHTLLRIDQRGQDDSNLILALTASYAAKNNPDDSALEFVSKGLMGGYPGEVAILPYYMKLKEYRDVESRDIWEYQLNLSKKETQQLVRHLWEVSGDTFKYYFFTENCSYRLLGMLDVIRPEDPMLDDFLLHAIPVDTIRATFQHGFISNTSFRPSSVSQFQHDLAQLDSTQQDVTYRLVQHEPLDFSLLDSYRPSKKNAILDVAFQYSRLIKKPGRFAAKRSLALLNERNQSEINSDISPFPSPELRDDEGHLSGKIQLESGQLDGQNYLGLSWRPAYHELDDPGQGYPLGSELRFLDLSLRYYRDDGVSFEDLTLVGIKSLKPRNRFFSPTSWSVSAGGHRVFEKGKRVWTPQVSGLLGPSWQFQGGLLYWLTGGEGRLSSKLDKGYDALVKTELGYVVKNASQQILLGASTSKSLVNDSDEELQLHAQHAFQLNDNFNGFWRLERGRQEERYRSEISAGLNYYF